MDFSNQPIYHNANDWPNRPVDIHDIRKANLILLRAEFDTAAALAEAAGTSPSYISQIVSKKATREIGDDLARRLEKAAHKERGWMDHNHSKHNAAAVPTQGKVGALTRHEEAIISIYRQLPSSIRKRFLVTVDAFAAASGLDVDKVA